MGVICVNSFIWSLHSVIICNVDLDIVGFGQYQYNGNMYGDNICSLHSAII